jgi:ceramide glucosyltransferase
VTTIAGAIAVRRFQAARRAPPLHRPAVTVLRPLCGAEPQLEQALASICTQAYPQFQLVLGVQSPLDPALQVVDRLRARFPAHDITLVCDPTQHGVNRKIGNLTNMLPAARHDILVFCDSDLHVAPDYLDRIVAALEVPATGLVTTVCTGLPVVPGIAAALGATAISHCFVPGALLSRAMGRQDCLGTTMALRRGTLAAIGGLAGLLNHLADDNVLGQLVKRLGMTVALAHTVPRTAVTELTLRALWQHEQRWARTIRGLEPVLYGLSVLQYPLFWAAIGLLLAPCAATLGLFAAAWIIRAGAAAAVDGALQPGSRPALLLLPARDVLSVLHVAASFMGARVVWRGQTMRADRGTARPGAPPAEQAAEARAPLHGVQPAA